MVFTKFMKINLKNHDLLFSLQQSKQTRLNKRKPCQNFLIIIS